MKICFITENIYSIGGVQRVLSTLTNELINEYEIDILCLEDRKEEFRDYYNLDKRINVEFIGKMENSNRLISYINRKIKGINKKTNIIRKNYKLLTEIYFPTKFRKKIIKLLNIQSYDIVIGVEGLYSLLLSIVSKNIKAKTVGWYHNSYDAYFLSPNKYYWNISGLFKKYIKSLDKCIVLTHLDEEKNKKLMNIKCQSIYNPLSFESREKSKCLNKNLLCVARLEIEQKGLDLLIDTFEIIAKKDKEWRLKIVGEGKDKDKLKDLIESKKLEDRILIMPHQDNIIDYYLEASIFISASRWEGFGLVITEAMECGLPIVSFKNSGPYEILSQNDSGILVENNNINKLAEELYELMINKEKRLFMADKSLKRVKDFKRKTIAQEWIKLFDNINNNDDKE